MHLKFHSSSLRGIGISVAGIVDSAHSRVVYSSNLGWQDLDIGSIAQENCPEIEIITVENDAKASALAELVLGKHGIASSNFIFLSIGTGIGAGIVVDNHIISGSSHAAGEYGHMTLIEGGELCSCGNKGCWEVYASDRATINFFLSRNGTCRGACREDRHGRSHCSCAGREHRRDRCAPEIGRIYRFRNRQHHSHDRPAAYHHRRIGRQSVGYDLSRHHGHRLQARLLWQRAEHIHSPDLADR